MATTLRIATLGVEGLIETLSITTLVILLCWVSLCWML